MKILSVGLFLLAWALPIETVSQQSPRGQVEGTWSARVYVSERAVSDPERLQLQINLDDENGRNGNNWGQSVPRSAFANLPAELEARQDVRFELRREAGLIVFDGRFESNRGVGTLTFTPNAAFVRALEQQANDTFTERQLFSYALLDVSEAFVKEMQALGFADLTLSGARKLRIHGVTTSYAREMRALAGGETLDADDLRQLRIRGVTPAYVSEMRAAGLGDNLRDLRQARIHGVTPAYAKEMAALGYKGLDLRQLRQFRIHGVTPGYVRQMADLGYRHVDARTLVQFRIHGVTPKFVNELKDAGYTNLSDEELVDWAIHGRRLLRTKRK